MSVTEVLLRLGASGIAGYLLGSLPSGVLIGKIFGNVDPRTQGSGKTGATNILRTLGPGPAALVVIMDVGKGVVAVLLARFLFFPLPPHPTANDHDASGSGRSSWPGSPLCLATTFPSSSILLVVAVSLPAPELSWSCHRLRSWLESWLLIIPILITRYVSLGSITAAFCSALCMIILTITGHEYWPYSLFAVVASAFIILSHHDNIRAYS